MRGGSAPRHLELLPRVGGVRPQHPGFRSFWCLPLHGGPRLPAAALRVTGGGGSSSRQSERTSIASGESGSRCMHLSPTPLCSHSVGRTTAGPWPPSTVRERESGFLRESSRSRWPRGSMRGGSWGPLKLSWSSTWSLYACDSQHHCQSGSSEVWSYSKLRLVRCMVLRTGKRELCASSPWKVPVLLGRRRFVR